LFILQAFYEAQDTKGRPTAILAKTFKGRNFPGIENLDHWHGKPLGDMATEVLQVSRFTFTLHVTPRIGVEGCKI